jgi:hypothetical protein
MWDLTGNHQSDINAGFPLGNKTYAEYVYINEGR